MNNIKDIEISSPQGTTTFCDNIRWEMGSKITLLGCYLGNIEFPAGRPGIIPCFAALVKIVLPINYQYENISIKILGNFGEEDVNITSTEVKPPPKEQIDSIKESKDQLFLNITIPFQTYNVSIPRNGRISARGYIKHKNGDVQLMKLGTIECVFQSDEHVPNKA